MYCPLAEYMTLVVMQINGQAVFLGFLPVSPKENLLMMTIQVVAVFIAAAKITSFAVFLDYRFHSITP